MILEESIYSLRRNGMRLDLITIKRLLEALGSPEKNYRKVIVGGTNGKGSTCATLSSLFTAAGIRTGLFTSPHLISFRERFRVNDKEIEDASLQTLIERVKVCAEQGSLSPTFFEYATAIAHLFFARNEAELAILEVGLGGRLDATNATQTDLAILTDISFDHQEYLGEGLTQIAQEKAAIISFHKPVLTTDQEPHVLQVIETEAKKKSAKLFILNRDFSIRENQDSLLSFQFGSTQLENIYFPLAGEHQRRNLALALAAFVLLSPRIDDEKIHQGLREINWRGRFQVISQNPKMLVDGAHNAAGIQSLLKTLAEKGIATQKTHLLLSIKSDKDWKKMLSLFPKGFASFTATRSHRMSDAGEVNFVPVESLAEQARSLKLSNRIQAFADCHEALSSVKSLVQSDEWMVAAGSLYFVGDVFSENRS